MSDPWSTWTAFEGERRLRTGSRAEAAGAAHAALAMAEGPILLIEDATGRVVDLDLRGSAAEVAARYAPPPVPPRPRGRPKLGVVAREVTLLPRHWDWLNTQSGGASAAVRRLVDQARQADGGKSAARARQDAAYRFMSSMAGDLPGYEEAIRALYASDRDRFEGLVAEWPADLRDHAVRLAWSQRNPV